MPFITSSGLTESETSKTVQSEIAAMPEAGRLIIGARRKSWTLSVTCLKEDSSFLMSLRAAVSGELERAYEPRGTERYSYPALAEQMASVVETAIERRASHAG